MNQNPLTAAMLADAFDCFWNASLGAAHRQQEGVATADIMASGMAAVAERLRYYANTPVTPSVLHGAGVIDLAAIPEGWWLYGLFHNHTPTKYAQDQHRPLTIVEHGKEPFSVKLQHVGGGKLTEGTGATPAAALAAAIMEVELRWYDQDRENE